MQPYAKIQSGLIRLKEAYAVPFLNKGEKFFKKFSRLPFALVAITTLGGCLLAVFCLKKRKVTPFSPITPVSDSKKQLRKEAEQERDDGNSNESRIFNSKMESKSGLPRYKVTYTDTSKTEFPKQRATLISHQEPTQKDKKESVKGEEKEEPVSLLTPPPFILPPPSSFDTPIAFPELKNKYSPLIEAYKNRPQTPSYKVKGSRKTSMEGRELPGNDGVKTFFKEHRADFIDYETWNATYKNFYTQKLLMTVREVNEYHEFSVHRDFTLGQEVHMVGEIRGNLEFLLNYLTSLSVDENFKLPEGSPHLVFHDYSGDYHSLFGLEISYILMMLSLRNPEKVTLLKSNIERDDSNFGAEFARRNKSLDVDIVAQVFASEIRREGSDSYAVFGNDRLSTEIAGTLARKREGDENNPQAECRNDCLSTFVAEAFACVLPTVFIGYHQQKMLWASHSMDPRAMVQLTPEKVYQEVSYQKFETDEDLKWPLNQEVTKEVLAERVFQVPSDKPGYSYGITATQLHFQMFWDLKVAANHGRDVGFISPQLLKHAKKRWTNHENLQAMVFGNSKDLVLESWSEQTLNDGTRIQHLNIGRPSVQVFKATEKGWEASRQTLDIKIPKED